MTRRIGPIDTRVDRIPPVQPGQRIELIAMPDDPNPIPAGTTGLVKNVVPWPDPQDPSWQVWVDWDPDAKGHKRALALVVPPDTFKVIS